MIKKKERELWVGKSRFYLGDDNILYETVVGEQDREIAISMREASDKLKDMVKGKINVLVDLNKARKPSLEARK